jgi:hypothetical protein
MIVIQIKVLKKGSGSYYIILLHYFRILVYTYYKISLDK